MSVCVCVCAVCVCICVCMHVYVCLYIHADQSGMRHKYVCCMNVQIMSECVQSKHLHISVSIHTFVHYT